jgi:hypothetical protein
MAAQSRIQFTSICLFSLNAGSPRSVCYCPLFYRAADGVLMAVSVNEGPGGVKPAEVKCT